LPPRVVAARRPDFGFQIVKRTDIAHWVDHIHEVMGHVSELQNQRHCSVSVPITGG
jgi:hypothetical protein